MMSFKLKDVEEQYQKDTKLKREDVEALLEWTKNQSYLPKITELQAILFLHSCYYQLETAQKVIVNYFTIRSSCPEIFECATEEVIRKTFFGGFISILPKQTPEGYVIMLIRLMDTRPENYNCLNHTKVLIMVLTLHLHQHGTANGLLLVFDMKGSSFGHMFRINLTVLRHQLNYVQEAAPIRLKGVHFVNAMPITSKFVAIIRPFTKSEILNLMKFHTTCGEMHEYIPKDCLPKEYEGEGSPIQELHDENIRNILDNLEFFKWHDSQIKVKC